jgi:hypothetical protein
VIGLAPSNKACHNVVAGALGVTQIVEVLCPSGRGPVNEVKEVLVRKPEAVLFGTRWNVRLVPDHIVSENPPAFLHRNRKP